MWCILYPASSSSYNLDESYGRTPTRAWTWRKGHMHLHVFAHHAPNFSAPDVLTELGRPLYSSFQESVPLRMGTPSWW